MRIQDLEKRTGVERTAIRYYEREGLLEPRRSDNGYRDYTEEDAKELERIRLMRELGVPLEQIKQLQTGELDLHTLMSGHTAVLRHREERMHRAGEICRTLASFEGGYRDLDTGYYQALLNAPALPGQSSRGERVTYSEPVRQEFHPIRRGLARVLDLGLLECLVYLFFIIVLRWKTSNPMYSLVTGLVTVALSLPVNALWLHLTGTTPGKWVLGIRVRSFTGERYNFSQALYREAQVLLFGRGLFMPLVRILAPLWCLYVGIKKGQEYLPWDEAGEVKYRKFPRWNLLHMALVPVLAVLPIVVLLGALPLEMLPVYSGNDMKLQDFANNFNTYVEVMDESCMKIDARTGIYGCSGVTVGTTLGDGTKIQYLKEGTFTYEYMGQELKLIRYNHSYYQRNILRDPAQEDWADQIERECIVAMLSVAAAQEGMGYYEIMDFLEELNVRLQQDASGGISWTVGNVMYYWKYDAEPVESLQGEEPAAVFHKIDCELIILINSN